MLNPAGDAAAAAAALKTPQRTVSLAQAPFQPSPPLYTPLPRTTSLPAQSLQYRESSVSVSPKTMPNMPPPAPMPYLTPSPVASRKRSLSISDHQPTPQPPPKKRKYSTLPPWARRERDGHFFERVAREHPQTAAPPHLHTQGNTQVHPQVHAQVVAALGPSPQPHAASVLEPSLDNFEPYNDLTRQVGDWLWKYVVLAPDYGPDTQVEVEAKIGSLLDPSSNHQRVSLPVASEALLFPGQGSGRPRFESLMSMVQHKRLNEYLNRTVRMAKEPGRQPVDYRHTRETDTFYDIPQGFLANLNPEVLKVSQQTRRGPRVRLTTDIKTNQITATIIKFRVADLEIYCPNDDFDCRISISLETRYPHPIDGLVEHLEKGVSTARMKDRLSYRHQGFQVDLTQVTPFANQADKVHELEVELDTQRLLQEGRKVQVQQESEYEKLVGTFLNNIRVINRAAREHQ
jgi:polynucleotide 5'-triphosphatase